MYWFTPIALLALVLTAVVVEAGPQKCLLATSLCFAAAPTNGSTTSVDMLVQTSQKSGWVAIALGSSMSNTDVAFLYRDAGGKWAVTRRFATGLSQPEAAPEKGQVLKIVQATTGTGDANGMHHILLQRPLANSGIGKPYDRAVATGATSMAWAMYEGTANISPAGFPIHSYRGQFSYNLLDGSASVVFAPASAVTAPAAPPAAPVEAASPSPPMLILIHAICMGLAWSVLSFSAIFTARFLKTRIPQQWFSIHRALFLGVLVLTIAGFVTAFLYVDGGAHFDSLHAIIGLAMLSATVLQVVLGFVIDKMFDPTRNTAPIRDKAHWALGYFLLVAGPINVILGYGFNMFPAWVQVANVGVIGLFGGSLVAGQLLVGQQHDHKATSDSASAQQKRKDSSVQLAAMGASTGSDMPMKAPYGNPAYNTSSPSQQPQPPSSPQWRAQSPNGGSDRGRLDSVSAYSGGGGTLRSAGTGGGGNGGNGYRSPAGGASPLPPARSPQPQSPRDPYMPAAGARRPSRPQDLAPQQQAYGAEDRRGAFGSSSGGAGQQQRGPYDGAPATGYARRPSPSSQQQQQQYGGGGDGGYGRR